MKKIILFFLLFTTSKSVFSFDMENYILQNKNQNLEIFLANFPYNQYLTTVDFTNFQTIQGHRYLIFKNILASNGTQDGDGFLYYLADFFLKTYPITDNGILIKNIEIGESYINPKKSLANLYQPNLDKNSTYKLNTNESYKTIGYYILSRVAEKIKADFKLGKFDKSSTQNQALLKRLETNKVYVSFEESQTKKLVQNLKKGKFGYVWDRVKIKAQPYICGKWKWASWVILIVLVILLLVKIPNFLKVLAVLGILPLAILKFTVECKDIPKPTQTAAPNFQQVPIAHFYPINKSEYLVDLYSLKNGNTVIGNSVWIKRPEIKSAYFAYSANAQFQNLKSSNRIIFAAAGGYTTDIGNGQIKPDGFTIQSGGLVNPVILHDRHGLVMFTDEGGVRLLNLNFDKIILPNKEEIESPLTSILAYSKLLKWCSANKATIFQTHLLAFSDSLLINPSKAKSGDRERRILAIVRDTNTETIYHALFDIPTQYDLATVSQEIFNIVASRGFKIEGIVNLDTGSYNIFNIFDENGNLLSSPIGPVNINNATNLIVYYK